MCTGCGAERLYDDLLGYTRSRSGFLLRGGMFLIVSLGLLIYAFVLDGFNVLSAMGSLMLFSKPDAMVIESLRKSGALVTMVLAAISAGVGIKLAFAQASWYR